MTTLETTILELLDHCRLQAVSRTKLVKLVYFVDFIYFQHGGRTLTGLQYKWDNYGPNAIDDEIVKAVEKLAHLGAVMVRRKKPNHHAGTTHYYRPNLEHPIEWPGLEPLASAIVGDVAHKYRFYTAGEIADACKLTPPFEHAKQGEMLDFDGPDAFYKNEPEIVGTITREEVEALQRESGISFDEILKKYSIA